MLLAKTKLNNIEDLIFKALINLYINHDEFISVNNVLRELKWHEGRNEKTWKCCGIY